MLELDYEIFPTYGLMTLSFMFFVPFVIGIITSYSNRDVAKASKIVAITMPLFSILGVILITLILGWEGIICALMAIPIFAIMSLIRSFYWSQIILSKP